MAAQVVTKAKLSASTSGRGILVVATATAGTSLHVAVAGSSSLDEVWLYAYNGHTADVALTIEWGGVTVPNDNIIITIPTKAGRYLVVDGLVINGGLTVAAFASVANVIVITGFINAIV